MYDVEDDIKAWRDRIAEKGGISWTEIEELEAHLRDEIEELRSRGLSPDEAFLVSVGRIGNADAVSKEFSRARRELLWKQLMVLPEDRRQNETARQELIWVIVLMLVAGTLGKIPALFGLGIDQDEMVYLKNASLFAFPSVAAYFFLRHRIFTGVLPWLIVLFSGSALAVNLYPYIPEAQTEILTAIHLPLFTWLVAGFSFLGDQWRDSKRRMDFLRLTGEAFIYAVLIGCGGAVLTAFTLTLFSSIGIDAGTFVEEFLIVYGVFGIPVLAVFLAEAKRSVIESMAPVLARIFTPLFLLLLAAFLVVMVVTGKSPFTERDFLIGFDLMLVIVLALTIYIIAARSAKEPPALYDYLTFALIAAAVACDATALSAVMLRIASFGISPNKVAALGENILLLGNLGGIAFLYIRFFRGRGSFSAVERWQTGYLPLYVIWLAVVALGFPPLFGYR